ncbi:MAG: hypothetical protein RIQ89_1946 [Bacteroidota bacterium]|jgi:mannitol-specific phosphotransferase system IIBC component
MKFNIKIKLLWLLMALLIAWLVSLFTGCEVLKQKKSAKADSTSVKKQSTSIIDSNNAGSVSTAENKTKEESEWWRVIKQFAKPDTNVTNNYYHQGQPATIIYEGGRGTKEEASKQTDSTWRNQFLSMVADALDSMNHKIESIDKGKHSQTKGVGLVTLLLLLGGFFILSNGAGFILKKYKISKR